MKLRYVTALLLACGLSTSGVHAQTATAAATPTARQLELSQELIAASGAKANYDQMMDNVFKQIFAQAEQGQSAKSQQSLAAIEQAEVTTMAKIKPKLFDAVEKAYAMTYSESEMESILAFDRTPAGQAMIAKAPLLSKNMMGGIILLMPIMKADMINGVCQSLHCTAAQRQAMIDKMITPHT
jgi:hypothetical protein